MNTRPTVSVPTLKAAWVPRRGRPIRTPQGLLAAVLAAVGLAAALLLLA